MRKKLACLAGVVAAAVLATGIGVTANAALPGGSTPHQVLANNSGPASATASAASAAPFDQAVAAAA